jgi:folate-binding protein YgfZ
MISLDEYRALLAGAGVIRRDDRGRLMLRGADRLSYLHGLLTNDILALKPGETCYAALLTPQGRMISDMRVFELGDRTLLDMEVSVAAGIREHLDRFVITEDVVVEDASSALAQAGVYGPDASRISDALRAEFARASMFVLPSSDLGVPGFDLVIASERADDLLRAAVARGGVKVGSAVCNVTRVEGGIPRFLVDMDTSTIPLEAGIEDRAISMTKGCYVGQEVIIRVLHRGGGRVAKKLVGLTAKGEMARAHRIASGDREIGSITSAVLSPRFGPIALGYVHRDYTAAGTEVSVQSKEGEVKAHVVSLPFTPSGT